MLVDNTGWGDFGVYGGHTATPNVDALAEGGVRFNNYTWLVPLIPTWGRISVTLKLESASGSILWEKSFEGKGTTFALSNSFNTAATKSITRLADSMVEAFSAHDFRLALTEEG